MYTNFYKFSTERVYRGYSTHILFDFLVKQGTCKHVGAMGSVNTNRKGSAKEPEQNVQKGGSKGDWSWLRAGNLFSVTYPDLDSALLRNL